MNTLTASGSFETLSHFRRLSRGRGASYQTSPTPPQLRTAPAAPKPLIYGDLRVDTAQCRHRREFPALVDPVIGRAGLGQVQLNSIHRPAELGRCRSPKSGGRQRHLPRSVLSGIAAPPE